MNNAASSLRTHSTRPVHKRLRFAPPLRLTPALCRVLAALLCLWLSANAPAARADGGTRPPVVAPSYSVGLAPVAPASPGALLSLQVGRTLSIPLPDGAKYSFVGNAALVKATPAEGTLALTAVGAGRLILTVETPAKDGVAAASQKYTLRIGGDGQGAVPGEANVEPSYSASVEGSAGESVISSDPAAMEGVPAMAVPDRQPALTATETKIDPNGKRAPAPRGVVKTVRRAPVTTTKSLPLTGIISSGSAPISFSRLPLAQPTATQTFSSPYVTMLARAQMTPDLPNLTITTVKASRSLPPGIAPVEMTLADPPQQLITVSAGPGTMLVAPPSTNSDAVSSDVVVSPDMQVPPTMPKIPLGSAPYELQAALPPEIDATAKRPMYRVTQGMARLLAFKSNILSVFFSDDNTMDARAVNARTIAVTGKGPGKSTLAVFLSRYAGDVVGRAAIYNIEVYPTVSRPMAPVGYTNATDAEVAIRTALNDPRVRVSVLQRPDGTLTAQLYGTLRDKAEVDAAVTVASFFVPNVVSGLYVDPNAPTQFAALNPTPVGDALLQSQLRNLFGNDTIELVVLPGGTMLKATVDSPEEAEAILSVFPSLGRQIQPFIVVRGAGGGLAAYTPAHPIQYGDELEMTRSLRDVTGISTVYVKRTARNALAVYGTVRNRTEYDVVRRYADTLLPQLQENLNSSNTQNVPPNNGAPAQTTGTTTSQAAIAPALSAAGGTAASPSTSELTGRRGASAPYNGNIAPYHVQMFVRVLDVGASAIRLVTVESTVVEISRNALKNLGTEFGTATLTGESFVAGTPASSTSGPGGTTTSAGTPSVTTRTIDPTVNVGQGLFGSFAGTGEFSSINPFRVRLNALMQNGAVRILSKPNLTAVEGADAQITIGGVRPVPIITTAAAAGGTQQTSVIFRRFGIILAMRPTLTDDDTIILQIRGDVTDLDFTTGITLNGAFVPGERVRSVDTTITMHEGDTLVLGGLISNESRRQTSKVPFLGDIPFIGSLFRSKRFENNETELAIFLSPRILRQPASPETGVAVRAVPGMPGLSNVDQQQARAFDLSTLGQGGQTGQ